MKDGVDGDAKASLTIVTMMLYFVRHRRRVCQVAVRTPGFAIPPNVFKVGNAISLRRKLLEDGNDIHNVSTSFYDAISIAYPVSDVNKDINLNLGHSEQFKGFQHCHWLPFSDAGH